MNRPITVFFDLDGVLADFVRGAMAYHAKYVPIADVRWDFPPQLGFESENDPAFWNPLGEMFWRNLGMLYDGMNVFHQIREHVGVNNVGILSTPCDTYGCVEGKRGWVHLNLPSDVWKRTFFGRAKDMLAGPGKLLIDDHEVNVDKFIKAGGSAVLVPRPWNREREHCDTFGMFEPYRLTNSILSAIEVMRGTSANAMG